LPSSANKRTDPLTQISYLVEALKSFGNETMLSNFAKSFSIDPSAPPGAASSTPTTGGGGGVASFLRKGSVTTTSGSPRSAQHAALLKTNVIPLALKLQREIRGRKYKVRRLGNRN
jgi:hypothetical protein